MSCFGPIFLGVAKASRDKGARGENEVVALAKRHDLTAYRTAALQAGRVPGAADVSLPQLPNLHIEVKRDERKSVDAMVRQAAGDAPVNSIPVVAWRRNQASTGTNPCGEWRADVPLAWLLDLLADDLCGRAALAARAERNAP